MRQVLVERYNAKNTGDSGRPSCSRLFLAGAYILSILGFLGLFASSFGGTSQSGWKQNNHAFVIFLIVFIVASVLSSLGRHLAGIRPEGISPREIWEPVLDWIVFLNRRTGQIAKHTVAGALADLDDRWILFSGVTLLDQDEDIDQVLLGPGGIFALEADRRSGKMIYDRTTSEWNWRRSLIHPIKRITDPTDHIVRAAGALEAVLESRVAPVTVFTNPKTAVDAEGHLKAAVLPVAQLHPWISAQPFSLFPQRVESMAGKLHAEVGKSAPAVRISPLPPAPSTESAAEGGGRPAARPKWNLQGVVPAILLLIGIAAVLGFLAVRVSGVTQPEMCTAVTNAYIRSGPSAMDPMIGSAMQGTCFRLDARTQDGYWLRITGITPYRGGWITVISFDARPQDVMQLPVAD
ncbi:MAG: NERD domain-containing protein [Anaerolineales bacterium]|nr:NERD domain-containing protein [Anaerolineales bacterium]